VRRDGGHWQTHGGPRNPVVDVGSYIRVTDEYDRTIKKMAAMRPVTTITVHRVPKLATPLKINWCKIVNI